MLNKILIFLLLFCTPAWAAVDIDGADDLLSCGASDGLLLQSSAMTISAWIKPSSVGEANLGRIIAKGASSGVVLATRATNTIGFSSTATTSLARVSSNDSITMNTWQHVLVTWTGSITATTVKIYVNGTETGYQTTTNQNSPTANTGETIYIGNSAAGDRTLDSDIEEIYVWDAVLDAADIETLAKSRTKRVGLQIKPANLKAYWPLDDQPDGTSGDGDTFRDLKGTNHCTGDNGANDTGLTAKAEEVLTYP